MLLARAAGWRLLLVAVLLAGLVAACTGDDGETATPTPPPESPTPASETESTPLPRVSNEPSADALETQERLQEFTNEYGEPPEATFARMRIPVLAMDAPVAAHVVDDAVMPAPFNPVEVAWYDMSAFPGMGGRPGEGRNAIFSAHVDYSGTVDYSGAHYRGPGMFFDLENLRPGNLIELDYRGRTFRYEVRWIKHFDANYENWGEVWQSDVPTDSLTLYTCGGIFDSLSRSYSDRVVVRAERVN